MHRVLLIRLGEAFSDPLERIEREYRARIDGGALQRTRARFVDAPPHAVGNLSNPVEVLREQLEEHLMGGVTDLLRVSSANGGEVVLDIFLLLNLGEPLVANAAGVVIDMLTQIVDENFRAIFPAHRTGPARRFRIVPIATLPAASDCKKSRTDAVDELAELHDDFVERVEESETEFPVDRIFLLDAVTGRGIADLDALVDQVYGFVRLVLFSGLRRSTEMVSLFEAECSDLFASFGVACCEVDFLTVRDTLAARMARRTAEALAAPGSCALPPVTDILPSHVLDDAERRDRALEELDSLPVRTLRADGSRAVGPLIEFYEELLERVTTWRETASDQVQSVSEPAAEEGGSGWVMPAGWAFFGALVLGGIVFAVAHFALLVSSLASAATGGAFAALAFLILFLVLWRSARQRREPEPQAGRSSEPSATEVLDALEGRIRARRSHLKNLAAAFGAIADAFAAADAVPAVSVERRVFLEPLVSDALLQHLYEGQVSEDDVRALADRFLESRGSWQALLTGEATFDAPALEEYSGEHFRELGGQPLFADPESRECVHDLLHAFVERWANGMPIALEGEAHKQFDVDGFYRVFDSAIVSSADLAADVGTCIRATNAVLEASRRSSDLDDVFVLTAVADIHPDAVAPLHNREPE